MSFFSLFNLSCSCLMICLFANELAKEEVFTQQTTMNDLLEIQDLLRNKSKPCMKDDRGSWILHYPWAVKDSLLTPPYPDLPRDKQGRRHPVFLRSECVTGDSLGNAFTAYFELYLCAIASQIHFVSIRNDDELSVLDDLKLLYRSLPLIYSAHSPNVNISTVSAKSHIAERCPCGSNNCHENIEALQYSNYTLIRQILTPALDSAYNSLRALEIGDRKYLIESHIEKSNFQEYIKINPHSLSTDINNLPPIPNVTIHYRCSDNLNGGYLYGLLPHRAYKKLIPREPRIIYVLTEGKHRATIGGDNKHLCHQILQDLFDYLTKAFPLSLVVILRGDSLVRDMTRIAASELTICSVSTFCLYPALISNTTVYMPVSNLFAKKTTPDLGPHFHWLEDPPIVVNGKTNYAKGKLFQLLHEGAF